MVLSTCSLLKPVLHSFDRDLTECLPFADTVVNEEHSSEKDTIPPLGELPDWSREANCEQDKPHKLVRWAVPCWELLEGSGQMWWSGLALSLNGHPMFRMDFPGQEKGRVGKPIGFLQPPCCELMMW